MTRDLIVTMDDGRHVAVREFPRNGPPVLLLHGAGLNLALWDGVATRIGSNYHLVAVDFIAHGESSESTKFSVRADLAAIESVIQTLNLVRPAVVGHSYGGIVAILYGAEHPDCPQVVNLDGLAAGRARSDHFPGKSPQAVDEFWTSYIDRLRPMVATVDSGDELWMTTELASSKGQIPGVDPDLLAGLLERSYFTEGNGTWTRRPEGSYLLTMLEELGQVDIFGAYRTARCPVAVVLARPQGGLGAGAEEFLRSYFAGFADAFPSLGDYLPQRRLITVETGHGIPLEAPEELGDLILRLVPMA